MCNQSSLLYVFALPCNPAIKIETDALSNYTIRNYYKRLFIKDYNKEILDYLFLKRSDYLILDIMNFRLRMLRNGEHIITDYWFFEQNREQFNKDFYLDKYKRVSPYEINEKEQIAVLDKLADEILTRYTPNQIIFPMFRGVEQYLVNHNNAISDFKKASVENMRKYNSLIARLNEYFSIRLKGCHIIEFPDYVLADQNHRFGLYELHYMDLYYEYAAACIEVIMQQLSHKEEIKKLSWLKENCSEKFELVRSRVKISSLSNQLKCTDNAMRYFESLVYDKISEFRLDALKGKMVSIMKSEDRAGKFFIRVCEENNINIVFSSYKAALSQLTDEEWEQCRQCDVVVGCDIHAAKSVPRDGIQPVMLSDIVGKLL